MSKKSSELQSGNALDEDLGAKVTKNPNDRDYQAGNFKSVESRAHFDTEANLQRGDDGDVEEVGRVNKVKNLSALGIDFQVAVLPTLTQQLPHFATVVEFERFHSDRGVDSFLTGQDLHQKGLVR